MLRQIPHKIMLYGKPWAIRWGDPTDPDWNPKGDAAQVVYSEARIVLHPKLRRRVAEAWEALWHEIFHIIDHFESKRRSYWNGKTRPRWSFSHQMMYRLDLPMGQISVEAGLTLKCVCRSCEKRTANPHDTRASRR